MTTNKRVTKIYFYYNCFCSLSVIINEIDSFSVTVMSRRRWTWTTFRIERQIIVQVPPLNGNNFPSLTQMKSNKIKIVARRIFTIVRFALC